MAQSPTPQTPFLGGGPKFNQAGNNAPLPGEKKAETPPPPPFGGPRIWLGIGLLLILLLTLYLIWGNGLMGVQKTGGKGGITQQDRGGLDPDSSQ